MKGTLGLFACVLVLFAVLGAGPALAGDPAAPSGAPAVAAAPAQPGCCQAPDVAVTLFGTAAICPSVQPLNPAPELKFGRTCRCSCGFPCKTDADCGPGGVCAGGISCC